MERETFTARLAAARCFSGSPLNFHLEFEVVGVDSFHFAPGQFISLLRERTRADGRVKQETRAYSLASPPDGNRFELCLNRVPRTEAGAGFFSNLLCDMRVGETIQFHGPHGDFVLRQPLADCLLIGHETGIAPLRAMLMGLFPPNPPNAQPPQDFSSGKRLLLLQSAPTESDLLYRDEFRTLAASHANFEHHPIIGDDRPQTRLLEAITRLLGARPSVQTAYICGLNAMVAPARARLKELGWDRKQIVFERYD